MAQITTNMTEYDYNYWINQPPTPFIQRCLKAYEAGLNKIGPGDWFILKINEYTHILLATTVKPDEIMVNAGFGYSPADCTKVSPELQKLLDKETEQL